MIFQVNLDAENAAQLRTQRSRAATKRVL